MAHYLFNHSVDGAMGPALLEEATQLLRVGMWGLDGAEQHSQALAPGDLVLIYLAAPARAFIGRAELASAVHDWTLSESHVYPGDLPSGVLLSQVQEWAPPVPMSTVLSRIPGETARADFERGVVRITAHEYETAVAVSGRA